MRILVINGPNLGLLGTRQPEIYGTDTLAQLEEQWRRRADVSEASLDVFQSNHEGAIVDALNDAVGLYDGLVINAGALTHYSFSLRDAVAACGIPTVEVHISNIYEREEWRHFSVLSEICDLTIVGRGTDGYLHAIDHLVASSASPPLTLTYGEGSDAVADLRTPPGSGPHPVALLVHGGFWRPAWKRDLMDPMAVALTRQGWATLNIEYTRGVGSYAAAVRDAAAAATWVKEASSEHRFDMARVVLIGHSAGGYLGLRLAHDGSPITGALSLGSVSDLGTLSALRPDDDPVELFLGGSRDELPRLWAQAELMGAPHVPVHLVHGADDDTIPPVQSESYARAMGDGAQVTIVEGCGHMDIIDPARDSWPQVVRALDQLVS